MGQVRNERYDFYKGLLIFGVIWGHMITVLKGDTELPVWIARFLRTYDMPMFAFITGIFLQRSIKRHNSFKVFCDKVGLILFPIIVWNIIFNLLTAGSISNLGRFWFLWSIFYCACIILAIERVFRFSEVLKCLVLIGSILIFHFGFGEKWNIGFLLFPCVIGYYNEAVRNNILKNVKTDKIIFIKAGCVIVFIILQCFWNVEYNVWNTGCNIFAFGTVINTSLRILYRGVIGITGCIVMKMFFDKLYDICMDKGLKMDKLVKGVVTIGRYTMELYILQTLFVEHYGRIAVRIWVDRLGMNPFVYNGALLGMIIAPCISVVGVTFLYCLQKYIRMIPCIGSYAFGIKLSTMIGKE